MGTPGRRTPSTTILLVEDEVALRELLNRALEQRGFRVIAAADGAAAWELLQASADSIHAIVTDVAMPRMNGLELAARVNTLPRSLPLIFISGLPRGSIGVDHHFLPKPFDPEDLVELIIQVLIGAPALDH
jgi:CheY-like chemotaxis protein